MAKLSPMMEQYVKTKEQYNDCILFYRLGDFYEMFFDDALLASRELEITLTGKECGLDERAPMCGVPYHAADNYITRLINKGYKVAIAEQVEDPKLAKGLVKREVIKIVTPGTNLSLESLDDSKNNYLMSIYSDNNSIGISVCDLSTGVFKTSFVNSNDKLIDEINKFQPSEIIYDKSILRCNIQIDSVVDKLNIASYLSKEYYFNIDNCCDCLCRHFNLNTIDGLGIKDYEVCVISSGALLQYLYDTQKNSLTHINHINFYLVDDFMIIDSSTRRNLELCETIRDKQKRFSLLWVLDKTKTAMGARKLREYVEQPLMNIEKINERLDAIEVLNNSMITREELREYMNSIYDLERLITRISLKTANPRDLLAFKNSIQYLPDIYNILGEVSTPLFNNILNDFDCLEDLFELLDNSLNEDAPIAIKEGSIFKSGYLDEIDKFRVAKTECKTWLANLEEEEREKTGIKKLKIKYNKVFGYYFEVTNSFMNLVPDYFVRKQTLANAERYSTDKLDELSNIILGAEDKLYNLEYETYVELRDKISIELKRVQKTATHIANIDAISSLSHISVKNKFIRPLINTTGEIDIRDGRHPVVEKVLGNDSFVSNDTYLNNQDSRISIITGPNMAGKSTYMRQTALIVLLAQIGSFVPASYANIGICDRIFTRVGASDDLASGQSTFMVEMNEVANIIRNATKNSLLILDEIGRGTSTFDGLSIAWAVVEHIANEDLLGAKALFATHYHELTELEGKISSVNNYCISIKEDGDSIVFLRKIIKGGADRSYGIQVARLAGVPDSIIKRANEISSELISTDITNSVKDIQVISTNNDTIIEKNNNTLINNTTIINNNRNTNRNTNRNNTIDKNIIVEGQLSLFSSLENNLIKDKLTKLDLNNITPIEAMIYLKELKELVD